MVMKLKFTHPALKVSLYLTATMEVCGCCQGLGRTFRGDLDESRLVESMESDGDQDGLDAYRAGAFDQTCRECRGRNVVQSVDWDAFQAQHPAAWAAVESWNHDEAEGQAESAAEARYFGQG
jgi:hypothetical protein